MTTRDVGDRLDLSYEAWDADGAPATATLVLTVTDPAGNNTTPSVTHVSPNIYDASFTLTAAGTWQWKWVASGNVVDVQYGSVLAQDPGPQSYGSLQILHKQLNIPLDNTDFDELLQLGLDAATEDVEDYCDGRTFWLARTASARVFAGSNTVVTADGYRLRLYDGRVHSIGVNDVTVEVSGDGTTWTTLSATAYDLWPENALGMGDPVEALMSQTDWRNYRKVRVTALWGFPGVPAVVNQATTLHASRFFHRKDSPEGVSGSSEWGLIRVPYMDPDVKRMLARWHTEFLAR